MTGAELEVALQDLIAKGLTFGCCTQAFQAKGRVELAYVSEAQDYQREGELEVDASAVVSLGDDPGAYVMAWIWVADCDVWEGPTDSEGEPCLFINRYRHEDCKRASKGEGPPEWTDQWSCACNDKCPNCGAEIEPYESDELDITGKPVTQEEDA